MPCFFYIYIYEGKGCNWHNFRRGWSKGEGGRCWERGRVLGGWSHHLVFHIWAQIQLTTINIDSASEAVEPSKGPLTAGQSRVAKVSNLSNWTLNKSTFLVFWTFLWSKVSSTVNVFQLFDQHFKCTSRLFPAAMKIFSPKPFDIWMWPKIWKREIFIMLRKLSANYTHLRRYQNYMTFCRLHFKLLNSSWAQKNNSQRMSF